MALNILLGEIVKPVCIIIPQMSGCITNTLNTEVWTCLFLIKDDDDEVRKKFKEICDLIKNKLGIIFHSLLVHDKKYLKTKVKEYDGVIKKCFLDNDVTKENKHYTCIACITFDSVMRMDKKNYPEVYLEECKYKIKKIKKTQISRFINTELDLDSESDTESYNDSDNDSDDDSE